MLLAECARAPRRRTAGAAAFPCCSRPGTSGTVRARTGRCRARASARVEHLGLDERAARRARRGSARPPRRRLPGVVPKTPERILTPHGTPSTGTRVPTAPTMSRAVPSPPAKSTRSTSRSASSAAAARVSLAVVGPAGRCSRCVTCRPASVAAIRAHLAGRRHGSRRRARPRTGRASARRARAGRDGRRAGGDDPGDGRRVVASLQRVHGRRSRPPGSRSARHGVTRHRARRPPRRPPRARGPTISSTSSSVTTNGGENAIVSASGSARVITPRSRHFRVTRAPTPRAAVERLRRIARRRRTRPRRSARRRAPRRRADGRRTPRAAAPGDARRARPPARSARRAR